MSRSQAGRCRPSEELPAASLELSSGWVASLCRCYQSSRAGLLALRAVVARAVGQSLARSTARPSSSRPPPRPHHSAIALLARVTPLSPSARAKGLLSGPTACSGGSPRLALILSARRHRRRSSPLPPLRPACSVAQGRPFSSNISQKALSSRASRPRARRSSR